jgi:hypothetical protein
MTVSDPSRRAVLKSTTPGTWRKGTQWRGKSGAIVCAEQAPHIVSATIPPANAALQQRLAWRTQPVANIRLWGCGLMVTIPGVTADPAGFLSVIIRAPLPPCIG